MSYYIQRLAPGIFAVSHTSRGIYRYTSDAQRPARDLIPYARRSSDADWLSPVKANEAVKRFLAVGAKELAALL